MKTWASASGAVSTVTLLNLKTKTMIEAILILALFSLLGYVLGPEDDSIDIERD